MHTPRAILALTATAAALAAAGALLIPSARAADTTYATSTLLDANGTTDTLTLSSSPDLAVPNTFTATVGDSCYRRSATGKMTSNTGIVMFTFTSYNTSCVNQARTKVTYYAWETPSHNVTSYGAAGGWRWDKWTHNKSRVSACLVSGTSSGHFKEVIPIVNTVLQTATIRHHLDVWCKGAAWS